VYFKCVAAKDEYVNLARGLDLEGGGPRKVGKERRTPGKHIEATRGKREGNGKKRRRDCGGNDPLVLEHGYISMGDVDTTYKGRCYLS